MKTAFSLIITLAAGLIASNLFNLQPIFINQYFSILTYGILCLGLYGSVYGINLDELRTHNKIVLSAVTFGVLFKTLFIGAGFYLIFPSPLAFILGVIVAQIDPVGTVHLMNNNQKLSATGQTIIRAWSSFDDPITVLLALYLFLPMVLQTQRSILDYLVMFGYNLIFCSLVYISKKYWNLRDNAQLVLLLFVFGICVYFQLTLSIAIIGLFLRPVRLFSKFNFELILQKLLQFVFLFSTFLIGALSQGQFDILRGVGLGLLAVLSQIVVSSLLTQKLHKADKINIAFAQYNGITSIVLAIFFEENNLKVVPIVIIALVTINLVYYFNNNVLKPRLLGN
jgi:NhaP-type Na+/H+ or K+/H+ antiporter